MKEYFEITSISRADLESLGYRTDIITDEQMARLAKVMADVYLQELYWTSMKSIAEDMGFELKWAEHGTAEDRQAWSEEQWREVICELVGSENEDVVVAEWNECIDHLDADLIDLYGLNKVYRNNVHGLSLVAESLTDKEKARLMMSLALGAYQPSERYFYVTSNCEIGSCNSVWGMIPYEHFYQFLVRVYN